MVMVLSGFANSITLEGGAPAINFIALSAANPSQDLWFSQDGLNWTAAPFLTVLGGFTAYSVSFAGNYWFVGGSNGELVVATKDWNTYQPLTNPLTGPIRGVIAGAGNYLVYTNTQNYAYTADFVNWTSASTPLTGGTSFMSYANSVWVAGGMGSSTAQFVTSSNLSSWTNRSTGLDFPYSFPYSYGVAAYAYCSGFTSSNRSLVLGWSSDQTKNYSKSTTPASTHSAGAIPIPGGSDVYPLIGAAYSPIANVLLVHSIFDVVLQINSSLTATFARTPDEEAVPVGLVYSPLLNRFVYATDNLIGISSDGSTWTDSATYAGAIGESTATNLTTAIAARTS